MKFRFTTKGRKIFTSIPRGKGRGKEGRGGKETDRGTQRENILWIKHGLAVKVLPLETLELC